MKVFPHDKSTKTRILVSNDDGIDSLGLKCLVKALSGLPDTEIYVCVPAEQQSGMSHSIILKKKLRIDEVDFPGATRAMKIHSTPADSVLFGLDVLALDDIHPDIVFSGINHGFNSAEDVPYSGTVGAAAEGAMDGIPSIAISTELFPRTAEQPDYVPSDFDAACAAAIKFLPVALKAPTDYIFNINVANIRPEEVKGWKVTTLGHVYYNIEFIKETGEDGASYYYYAPRGRVFGTEETNPGTDTAAFQEGYVSLSLVRVEYTYHEDMDKYREIVKDWKL